MSIIVKPFFCSACPSNDSISTSRQWHVIWTFSLSSFETQNVAHDYGFLGYHKNISLICNIDLVITNQWLHIAKGANDEPLK
jgi:hypothetical protein